MLVPDPPPDTAGRFLRVDETKANRIAELDDVLRKTFFVGGRVVMTEVICALPEDDQSAIREKAETFDAFSEDNEPYGVRDFGSFEHAGHKVF